MKKTPKKEIVSEAPFHTDFSSFFQGAVVPPVNSSVFLELGRGVVAELLLPDSRSDAPNDSPSTGFWGRFYAKVVDAKGVDLYFPMEKGKPEYFSSLSDLYDTRDCTRSLAYQYFPESRDTRAGAIGFEGVFGINNVTVDVSTNDSFDMFPALRYIFSSYGARQTEDDTPPPSPQEAQTQERVRKARETGRFKKRPPKKKAPLKIKGPKKAFFFVIPAEKTRPMPNPFAHHPWLSVIEKARAKKAALETALQRAGAEKCTWSAGTAAESSNIQTSRPDINSPAMVPLGFLLGS